MPDEPRQRDRERELLDGGAVRRSLRRPLQQLACCLHDVLIRERRGGIDAVHHGVGPVLHQELGQEAAAEHVFRQLAQQVVQQHRAMLGARDHGAAPQFREGGRQEHVAPLHGDGRAAAVGLERRGRSLHLLLEQRHEDDAPGRCRQHPPGHRQPDEPAAPEDHHRAITQFH